MPHILRRISPFRFQLRPNGSFVDGVEEASLSVGWVFGSD